MKTVIIYDQCGAEEICFFVVDGDMSHLHRIYANASDEDELVDELMEVIEHLESIEEFPVEEVKNGARVIVAGFMP